VFENWVLRKKTVSEGESDKGMEKIPSYGISCFDIIQVMTAGTRREG
jgi:hypothetical protein